MAEHPTGRTLADRNGELEAILVSAREQYLSWAHGALGVARDAAPNLASEQCGEAWETVFGVFHDLKGGGGSVGLDLLTQIGDSACRQLRPLKSGGKQAVRSALAHIVVAQGVLDQGVHGDGGELGAKIMMKLEAACGAPASVLQQAPPGQTG